MRKVRGGSEGAPVGFGSVVAAGVQPISRESVSHSTPIPDMNKCPQILPRTSISRPPSRPSQACLWDCIVRQEYRAYDGLVDLVEDNAKGSRLLRLYWRGSKLEHVLLCIDHLAEEVEGSGSPIEGSSSRGGEKAQRGRSPSPKRRRSRSRSRGREHSRPRHEQEREPPLAPLLLKRYAPLSGLNAAPIFESWELIGREIFISGLPKSWSSAQVRHLLERTGGKSKMWQRRLARQLRSPSVYVLSRRWPGLALPCLLGAQLSTSSILRHFPPQ